MTKEYALYKGEEIQAIGTLNEIAEQTGFKKSSLRRFGTPSYQERSKKSKTNNCMLLIKLEDDEEEDDTTKGTKH